MIDHIQYADLPAGAERDTYVQLAHTGTNRTNWQRYFVKRDQIELGKEIDNKFAKLTQQETSLKERIKDLTVRNNHYCFTGFRDENLERKITRLGGHVHNSVINGLDYIVAKDPHSNSGKMLQAKQNGAKIIGKAQLEDFLRD